VGGIYLARELEVESKRYASRRRSEDLEANRTAFQQGRRVVADLVAQAVGEARQRVTAMGPTLSQKEAELIQDRLQEVDRRLATLMSSGALS
jgi:hypothetical protein